MSLVHEALQKAEREKQRKTGDAPASPHTVSPAVTPRIAPTEPLAAAAMRVTPLARDIAPASPVSATRTVQPQKSQYAVLSVLFALVAVVAIVAIVYLVSRATSTIRESREVVTASATTVAPSATKPVEASKPVPAPTANQTRTVSEPATQPTVSAPTPGADTSRFKLTGIMKDPASPDKFIAVLNGRMVYEKDDVDGATVKQIERDRVTLDIAGRESVLRLN
jgi:hypothetical protein